MMNKLTFFTLGLLSVALSGCMTTAPEQTNTQQSGTVLVASTESTYFPNSIIQPMVDESFNTMAKEYGTYASYFNVCQKKPDEPVCGAPYQTAMTRYKQTKANHDVLSLLWESDLKNMPLPKIAENALAESLVSLGYLEANEDNVFSYQDTKLATDTWMHDKGLPETESLLLMHQVLVKSEALKIQYQG